MTPKKSLYRTVPLTLARTELGALCHWTNFEGGRVWISRHGRVVSALVPLSQLKMLERFEERSMQAERARMERDYAAFKRAKAGQPMEPPMVFVAPG